MKALKITNINKLPGKHLVRDIEVNNSHHYLLENGVISHNSGGGGLKYAASTIVYLSKKKYRDIEDKKVILGSVLTATLEKSRFTRYGLTAELLLTHEAGLDKYWGLFEFGKASGLLVAGTGEKGNKIKVNDYQFPDGQVGSRKEIDANPSQYFDSEINFAAYEELCARSFLFGKGEAPPVFEEEEEIEPQDA